MNDPATISEDYITSGEAYWRVEDFSSLAKVFGLRNSELTAWHDCFAGQGRAWEILRRLYRVAPLIGDLSADDLRPWTREELAEKWGVSVAVIDSEIKGAAKRWREHSHTSAAAKDARIISDDELKALTRFSEGDGLDEQTIDRLLTSMNFTQVKDPTLRAEVAHRIVSLKEYLADSHTRISAREVIRMEISMHAAEQRLIHWQAHLEDAILRADAEKDQPGFIREKAAEMIESARNKLEDADKTLRQLSKDHYGMLQHLGADQIDMTARKRIFIETATYLIDRAREWHLNPENAKADGVFTHAEVNWQLDSLGERDPQYRPDIVLRINEAMAPENLWNPDYVPTPIQRQVQRELLSMVKRIRTVRQGVPEDDDVPETIGWREDDEDPEDDDAAMPRDVVASLPLPDDDAPSARPWTGGPQADESPAAGFF